MFSIDDDGKLCYRASNWNPMGHCGSIKGRSVEVCHPRFAHLLSETSRFDDESFQRYWRGLGEQCEFSSEFRQDFITGTTAFATVGKTFSAMIRGTGTLVDFDFQIPSESELAEIVNRIEEDLAPARVNCDVQQGIFAVLAERGIGNSRPGFTLFVEGPGGGSDAANVFLDALDEQQVSGLLARQILNDSVGVIRCVFAPEWHAPLGGDAFGIDWESWQDDFQSRSSALFEAMFAWADYVLEVIDHLRDTMGLMFRSVCLESYEAVVMRNVPTVEAIDRIRTAALSGFPSTVNEAKANLL